MAKNDKQNKDAVDAEMTLEEARAFRASLHKPVAAELTAEDKQEEFRKLWAQEKSKYPKSKVSDLEHILWLHLKASRMDKPEQFEAGISHFGLKKV